MNDTPLFSYLPGNSIAHRIPAISKVFLILFTPPLIFLLPLIPSLILIPIIFILSKLCGFSFSSHYRDIKPILIYSFFILIASFIATLISFDFSESTSIIDFFSQCIPSRKNILIITHLIATIQFTSLFFKTTTSIALKDALEKIEQTLSFGKSSGSKAKTFALFLHFIPTVFEIWFQIERSWYARGGKKGIRKIATLIPVFISVSLEKAQKTFFAFENRS